MIFRLTRSQAWILHKWWVSTIQTSCTFTIRMTPRTPQFKTGKAMRLSLCSAKLLRLRTIRSSRVGLSTVRSQTSTRAKIVSIYPLKKITGKRPRRFYCLPVEQQLQSTTQSICCNPHPSYMHFHRSPFQLSHLRSRIARVPLKPAQMEARAANSSLCRPISYSLPN